MDKLRDFAADFAALAQSQPDRMAVIDARAEGATLSYRELHALTLRCLALLQDEGLKPGACILSLMPNAVETLVLFYASIMGGYRFAPLPCTATRTELEKWVALVKPDTCFCTRLVDDDTRAALEGRTPTRLIEADMRFSWLPERTATPAAGGKPLLYVSTSGTTGEPKAIVLDANILWSSGGAFMRHLGIQDAQLRFWNFLPMSYLGGLFNLALIPLSMGASVVVDEPFSGKTFLNFWPTIERFDINALWLVPTIVRGLLTLASRTGRHEVTHYGDKVRYCLLGTAPIDLATKQNFEAAFRIPLLENFALSETTFFSSETPASAIPRKEGSVGEILPYAQVRITPVDDGEKQAGGEIAVKSPFLFSGYLQADGAVAPACDAEGFFATGDLGIVDGRGTLTITGRRRDIIKKGGYLVPLREIEILSQQHPDVAEAAAVKVDHEFYGESYVLFLRPRNPAAEGADFSQWLRRNLVKHKWPEKVLFVADFPRTASGKVRKNLLLENKPAA